MHVVVETENGIVADLPQWRQLVFFHFRHPLAVPDFRFPIISYTETNITTFDSIRNEHGFFLNWGGKKS